MNDVHDSIPVADATREQLIELFLQRTLDEIEQLRRDVPDLIRGDIVAWQELRVFAQRVAGLAKGLELGVLSACSRELASLADEKFAGIKLDAHFLLATTSAIEMVAIELNRLLLESN
jgi:hypothetical protein